MSRDGISLQLIGNSLLYGSEEMGLALRNSAYSPNIKERMDHSAAIFDPEGKLLAQAEHIPVHLGSLPWGLKNLLEACRRERLDASEGSMVVSNNPYITGTHLNDVTVVAPVYYRGELAAFVVNKAHHSDVGGKVPGSISMESKTLEEEGYVLEPSPLMRKGEFVDETVRRFTSASRTPAERRGDLKAQVAANYTGAKRVTEIISKYGLEAFRRSAVALFAHSESLMLKRLSVLRPGVWKAEEELEGAEGKELLLRVKVTVTKSGVGLDYSGTAPQVDYPLNAILGVTISGAFYVIRTLTGDDVPANHGAFAKVKVEAPSGSLLNPTYPHPVGGGNVETSQRNADLIFRALAEAAPERVPAASGGSMNNVMVGGKTNGRSWAFYETIGVGLGGRRAGDGIDGIQANMTNTMNTPVEELERSYPMMITRYEFRTDSSGSGKNRGGSGLVRTYKILSGGTTFTVIADRERHSPWGLRGGRPGGRTLVLLKRRGAWVKVPGKSTHRLGAGDVVEIRTAGGGGYGRARQRKGSRIMRDVEDGILSKERADREYEQGRRS